MTTTIKMPVPFIYEINLLIYFVISVIFMAFYILNKVK